MVLKRILLTVAEGVALGLILLGVWRIKDWSPSECLLIGLICLFYARQLYREIQDELVARMFAGFLPNRKD